jgi:two-component system response regulator
MKKKARTILLIEDDEAHATLITRILEEVCADAEIQVVNDGQKALDYLFHSGKYAAQEMSTRPDLVLLDLRLPRVDGQEVLKAIKQSEALKAIPVVVLTTSESEYDVVIAYRNHANSYRVKPLGFGEFSELLRELSTYWLVKNRLPEKELGVVRDER